MWQVLCGDEAILRRVFLQLLEVLTLSLPYQEKHKGNKIVLHPTEIPKAVRFIVYFLSTFMVTSVGNKGLCYSV